MRAGALDRQVTIEKKVVTTDADWGTQKVDWIPIATTGSPAVAERFWAEMVDALPSRDEALSLGVSVARRLTRFRLRYRDDIDSSMRLRLHGDGDDLIYQIVGGPANISKEGRKNFIELLCERYSS